MNRSSKRVARERFERGAAIKKCNIDNVRPKPLANCVDGRCVPVENPNPTIYHDCVTISDRAVIPAGCGDWTTVSHSSVSVAREVFDNAAAIRKCRSGEAPKPEPRS